MGDDEDRMKLSAMNELDREMILAERADARDAARERHRAEKSLKQAQEQQQRAAEKVLCAFFRTTGLSRRCVGCSGVCTRRVLPCSDMSLHNLYT